MTEICKAAVECFGAVSQTRMMFEEMAELQKELCKYDRGAENTLHIAEEIADVQIMLEQMIILHDCREAVEDWRTVKLMRLRGNINETNTRRPDYPSP